MVLPLMVAMALPPVHNSEQRVLYDFQWGNSIELLPGDNVSIINNQFLIRGVARRRLTLSAEGYQGTYCISNILISGNYVTGNPIFVELGGSGSPDNSVSVTGQQLHL